MAELAQDTSILVPAYNEAQAVAGLISALTQAARWHEIIVIDDGSTDGTGEEAAKAGAVVIRHPYNKGNGAAVKSGLRKATGTFVLIVDADGQHQPHDTVRLVNHLDQYELVVGARSADSQASWSRRVGNDLVAGFGGGYPRILRHVAGRNSKRQRRFGAESPARGRSGFRIAAQLLWLERSVAEAAGYGYERNRTFQCSTIRRFEHEFPPVCD